MSDLGIHMVIAEKVYEAEKLNAKMLGLDRLEVAMLSFAAFCGVYVLALEAERPAVLTRFRPMVAR